eukprot:TRINITY_DN671_c6_g1_i1.p1 TRINITY_DN671_c6_g1~~TRINITY_DN671_c6_g1_i1.p1  ORF type:complete len:429 (+),score=63.12 TRINITY_DN671_c6_g1_i1:295-1581(+)
MNSRQHLTNKQREQLHQALLEYLKGSGFTKTYEALLEESHVDPDPKSDGLLEKKWTSVIRLQKKIMELEDKNKALEEELNAGGGRAKKKGDGDDLPRPPARHTLSGHRSNINAVRFHPVFSQLATASEDATIKLWDYDSGELEKTLKGHTLAVQDIAFDHTAKFLASCSADLSIKLWDMQSHKCVKTMHGHDHNVSSITFTPSGDMLISASRDKTVKFWEVATGYCVRTLNAHEEWVKRVIINDEGTMLATCSYDQTIKLWNFNTKGEALHTLRGHEHVIECIAFSPPSTPILGGDETNDTGGAGAKKPRASAGAGAGQPGRGSGAYIASGSRDKLIKIWDTATGQCVVTLVGHDNWVRGVMFHPNGKYLMSVSDDKSICIWDLKQQRCIKTISDAHPHFVACLDYNKRFPLLATGGVDATIKVWESR